MNGSPKDRGYSWLVLVAAVLSQLIYGTLSYGCLSVLTYVWIEMFSITTDTAVWASSILAAVLMFSGPVIALIVQSLGAWRTQLIGTLLSVVAAVATAFVTQFWHVLITFSLLQGFGYAMTQLATIDVIADYFDRHKDKIYACLVTSFCAGLLLGPAPLEYILSIMGYRSTMLALAAIGALNIPSAFIYRRCQHCCKEFHGGEVTDSSIRTIDNAKAELHLDSDSNRADEKLTTELATRKDKPWFGKTLSRVAQQHWTVLKQPAFTLILVYYILSMAGDNSVYTLVVDFYVRKEVLTLPQAALGMTLCGVSTVAGSILLVVLSHWQLDRLMVNITSTLLFGITIILFPVCQSVASSYSLMIIFGLTDSVFATNIVSFISQQFDNGDEKSSLIRLSYVFCCMGIGSLLGPIIAGNLITVTGLNSMFHIMGSLPIVAAVMLIPYWAVIKFSNDLKDDKF